MENKEKAKFLCSIYKEEYIFNRNLYVTQK